MASRLFLVAILILVGACRSETSTEPPPASTADAGPRDVCSMLTVDELNTAAGMRDAIGESSTSGGADVCTWTAGGKSVVVQVFPSSASYDQARAATAEDITGIGDKAFYMSDTGTLVAMKGSTPISVQIVGAGGDAAMRKGEATAIAHLILGKVSS